MITEQKKQLSRVNDHKPTIRQLMAKPPLSKGTKIHAEDICVTFKYKRYRQLLYLKRDKAAEDQELRMLNDLRVFRRNIELPSFISEYGLDK